MSIKNKHREKNEQLVMGMEVGHLIEDAESWWDQVGSDKFRHRSFSGDTETQQEAMNASNPAHPNYLGKSGIIQGFKWFMLTPAERHKVVKAYALTIKGHTLDIS